MKLFDVWKSEIKANVPRSGVKRAATEPAGRSAIAYVVSRFPRVTETFVLQEMLELQRTGQPVLIYPLLRVQQPVRHPEVEELIPKVHYSPFLSTPILLANWYWLRKSPRTYIRVFFSALKGCWGSANLFFGALGILPKSAHLARLMKERGILHVHAHFATHPALAAWIIFHLSGITYSFTAHAHDIFVHTQMLPEKVRSALFVVTISRFNKDYLLKLAPDSPEEKIKVIHCGIDLETYRLAVHSQKDSFQILCVASLEPYKGIEYLLRACRILKEKGLQFHCIIVGEGRERKNLETSISHYGIADFVRLLGAQSHEVVVNLIMESDIFVLPSIVAPDKRMEGIPVALMEAMAGGLPVIASNLSGISELVQPDHNGVLVSGGDYQALADAVYKLASDWKLREEMGKWGRETVAAGFQLSPNVAALRAEFQKILHNRKGLDELLVQQIRERMESYFPDCEFRNTELTYREITTGSDSHIYELSVPTETGDTRRVILKMHRPGQALQIKKVEAGLAHAENEYRSLQFLWSQLSDQSALYVVPKPLDFFPEYAAVLMEESQGKSMAQCLRWHRFPFGRSTETCIRARSCGEWLRLFHDVTAKSGNVEKVRDRMIARFRLDLDLAKVAGLPDKLADSVDRQFQERFEQTIGTTKDTVGHHCDFGPYNIFFDEKKVTVIDFEGMEDGMMYEDLCYFICMIQLMPSHHISQRLSERIRNAFVEGYFQGRHVDSNVLNFFRRIQMVNIMAHNPLLSGRIGNDESKRQRILGRFIGWFQSQANQ